MKRLLLPPALATLLFALAATSAYGAELHLTASDTESGYGKTSFSIWNIKGGGTEAPTSANDYVVDGGFTMRFPSGSYPSGGWVWPGKSLRIGTVGGSQGILVITRNANSTHTFSNGGLILAKGRIQPWVGNYTQTFTGTITVTAPESAPFDVMLNDTADHPNQTFAIAGTLKGAAGTALRVYSNTAYPATFKLTTTPTAFAGTVIVGNGDASKVVTCSTDYNKEMPGGFRITTGSTLTSLQNGKNWKVGFLELQSGASFLPPDKGTRWTVGDLTLASGSTFRVRIDGTAVSTLTVTNSLDVAPGAILEIFGAPGEGDTSAGEWAVMTLPQDKGTIPLGNFALSGVNAFPGSLIPQYSLSTNAASGKWQLLLRKTAHDYLAVNDSGSATLSDGDSSACTNGVSWTTGEVPQQGRIYVAQKDKGNLTAWPVIRTPYQSEPYAFPGDALCLANGSQMVFCGRDTTFPLLSIGANTTLQLGVAGVPAFLRGKVSTVGGSDTYPQRFQAYQSGLTTVEAEIAGNGTIWICGRSGSGAPYGDIEFTAINTNFMGKIKACAGGVANVAASADNHKHERVFVADARNLGGPLDAFRADALELADYSVLEARNDVDMNVANRGVTITGNAGFAAPRNVTLAISNDITWNGVASKTGAGTLALGGAPHIASGVTAALSVEEGFLQVRSTNAVDGVSVSFADGAYLLVDPAATGDVATYGAVDLSATPFGGTLPVALDFPGGAPEGEATLTFAVATVADAARAKSLTASARKIPGRSVEFSTRANADGTATILASVRKNAFMLIIR